MNLLFIYDENVIIKIKIKMTAASRRHEVHNARSSGITRACLNEARFFLTIKFAREFQIDTESTHIVQKDFRYVVS